MKPYSSPKLQVISEDDPRIQIVKDEIQGCLCTFHEQKRYADPRCQIFHHTHAVGFKKSRNGTALYNVEEEREILL